jgi:NADH-quinone oxidoreductase subunit E
MARLTRENTELAREIISRYPRPRSALIPLLHLAQEQDGYVTEDAMEHLGELIGMSPAEVLGTCSFYEMFKTSAPTSPACSSGASSSWSTPRRCST